MRLVVLALGAAGCGFTANPQATKTDAAIDTVPVIDAPPDAPNIDGAVGSAFKKVFTTDPAKITGNLTGFPVWVKLTGDNDLKLRAAAANLYFTNAAGAPLEWELQRFDKATGDLEAWVRMDLADATPTIFELRYGDPGPAHAPNPLATFSNSFVAVWHLEDSLNGASATVVAEALGQRVGTAVGGPSSTTASSAGASCSTATTIACRSPIRWPGTPRARSRRGSPSDRRRPASPA